MFRVCFAFIVLLMLSLTQAFADSKGEDDCLVEMHLLEAYTGNRPGSGVDAASMPFFSDIREQLTSLPFDRYESIDSVSRRVRMHRENSFLLGRSGTENFVMKLRLHQTMGDKVHLTIKWDSASGGPLLATRMKVGQGKNVLLGADRNSDKSSLVSIKCTCN